VIVVVNSDGRRIQPLDDLDHDLHRARAALLPAGAERQVAGLLLRIGHLLGGISASAVRTVSLTSIQPICP
jgi:hypothetical protein